VVKGLVLEIRYLESIDSTHLYLLDALKQKQLKPPVAVLASKQTSGIGSRCNSWISLEGNLFLSFCIHKDTLPADLPMQSMSIYFSFLLKELLSEKGSKVWLKWPNDFYIDKQKIGGTITAIIKDEIIICSIGLNLTSAPRGFGKLDIAVDRKKLIFDYFLKLKQENFWKDIFIKYKVEFLHSTSYLYHDKESGKKVSLQEAKLLEDGSIYLENRRIYSLR